VKAAELRKRIEEDYRRGVIGWRERAALLELLDRHPEAVRAFLEYLEALAELKRRLG